MCIINIMYAIHMIFRSCNKNLRENGMIMLPCMLTYAHPKCASQKKVQVALINREQVW